VLGLVGALALLAAACGGSSGGGSGPLPTPAGSRAPAPSGTPQPTSASPSSVTFSPPVIRLDNPTSPGEHSAASSFTVDIVAFDENGVQITPSEQNPITVALYGVPAGVITPTTTTIGSGSSATFQYDGSYFANPITLAAWVNSPNASDSAAARVAGTGTSSGPPMSLDRTQLVHQNPIACSYGTASYALPVECNGDTNPTTCAQTAITDGPKVKAAVGFDTPSSSDLVTFAIDTGSLGVVVPAKELGPDAIGPGAQGTVFYDSSGNTYAGNYYIAPVSLAAADGSIVSSSPIKVLGITTAYCAKGYPKCDANPPKPNLHYLGVGFDRGTTNPDDQLGTPADNPFLNLTNADGGADTSPGYVLGGSAITVGITSTSGYGTVPLTPSSTVPGDWTTMSGCYGFPDLPMPNQFCGTLLLDVGIVEMFIDLEKSQRPAGAEDQGCDETKTACKVPLGTTMQIIAGSAASPAASYDFTVSDQPTGPAPTFAQWIDSQNVFVNTGRHPLFAYDYLYDARCGNVGFHAK
jgi:hypothetical protein